MGGEEAFGVAALGLLSEVVGRSLFKVESFRALTSSVDGQLLKGGPVLEDLDRSLARVYDGNIALSFYGFFTGVSPDVETGIQRIVLGK